MIIIVNGREEPSPEGQTVADLLEYEIQPYYSEWPDILPRLVETKDQFSRNPSSFLPEAQIIVFEGFLFFLMAFPGLFGAGRG